MTMDKQQAAPFVVSDVPCKRGHFLKHATRGHCLDCKRMTTNASKTRKRKKPKFFRGNYTLYPSDPCWDAVCIPLTLNRHTIVSIADYELATQYKWQAYGRNGLYYAYRKCREEGLGLKSLHRLIMEPDDEVLVDHKNGNGLDNRRENLRFATVAQNHCNTRPIEGRSSPYKGVSYDNRRRLWVSRIKAHERFHCLGYFEQQEDAAHAYNDAAAKLHGDFARLNTIIGEKL